MEIGAAPRGTGKKVIANQGTFSPNTDKACFFMQARERRDKAESDTGISLISKYSGTMQPNLTKPNPT